MSDSVVKTSSIMIIDDEAALVRALIRFLTKKGYIVHGALTGSEGLRQIAINKPDLILLDMNLPEPNMQGRDMLAYHLGRATAGVPIIVMTGGPLEDLQLSYTCMKKPVNYEELLHAIEEKLPPKPDPVSGLIRK